MFSSVAFFEISYLKSNNKKPIISSRLKHYADNKFDWNAMGIFTAMTHILCGKPLVVVFLVLRVLTYIHKTRQIKYFAAKKGHKSEI